MAEGQEWDRVLDAIHGGVVHALNGRVQGLGGILDLATMRGGMDDELRLLLEDELQRLQRVAAAVRSLPTTESKTEAIALQDTIDAAVALNRLGPHGTVTVSAPQASSVVRADRGDVIRCLLLLLAAVAATVPPFSQSILEIVEAANSGKAALHIRMTGITELRALNQSMMDAARLHAARFGGTVQELEPAEVVLSLPVAE